MLSNAPSPSHPRLHLPNLRRARRVLARPGLPQLLRLVLVARMRRHIRITSISSMTSCLSIRTCTYNASTSPGTFHPLASCHDFASHATTLIHFGFTTLCRMRRSPTAAKMPQAGRRWVSTTPARNGPRLSAQAVEYPKPTVTACDNLKQIARRASKAVSDERMDITANLTEVKTCALSIPTYSIQCELIIFVQLHGRFHQSARLAYSQLVPGWSLPPHRKAAGQTSCHCLRPSYHRPCRVPLSARVRTSASTFRRRTSMPQLSPHPLASSPSSHSHACGYHTSARDAPRVYILTPRVTPPWNIPPPPKSSTSDDHIHDATGP